MLQFLDALNLLLTFKAALIVAVSLRVLKNKIEIESPPSKRIKSRRENL
jgi:hypothetical protein